jgi:peptidoglycan/LPS O-acetylase OafA/YrhL
MPDAQIEATGGRHGLKTSKAAMNENPGRLQSKPRYEILDGLRGVAAVMVVVFHIFEAHAASPLSQVINHGYLAVDFFFLLSGFVIGYAYDDRWTRMGLRGFFTRRLIRLHPMVIMGSIIGALTFYFGQSELFPLIAGAAVWKMLLVMLVGCTMVPLLPSMDIRSWQEMYPLNGPAWSLFFEYLANLMYALVVRRFSKKLLAVLVLLAAGAVIHLGLTSHDGDFAGGWSVDGPNLHIGFTRLMFPFFGGLLLFRLGKLIHVRHAFWVCSSLIVVALALPRLGGEAHYWINGLYESFCIIVIFPLIVAVGAGGTLDARYSPGICEFLGRISYPIYITHYPLIYIYTAYVTHRKLPLTQTYPYALLVFFGSLALAYVCLRFYDEPLREWLKKRLIVVPEKN